MCYENLNEIETYEYPFEGSGLRYEIQAFVNKINAINESDKNSTKIITDCANKANIESLTEYEVTPQI